jgi:hypothetical protein
MARQSRSPRGDAAAILQEVVLTGQSSGWSGEIEQRDEVSGILAGFGVVYTDDLWGTWEPGELHRLIAQLDPEALHALRDFACRLLDQ